MVQELGKYKMLLLPQESIAALNIEKRGNHGNIVLEILLTKKAYTHITTLKIDFEKRYLLLITFIFKIAAGRGWIPTQTCK